MRVFSTDFPVGRIPGRAPFIAQVIAWLRGTNYSNVFNSDSSIELDSDYAVLKYGDNEELIFREIKGEDTFRAIGFRHDFNDTDGRLWRTEAVLSRGTTKDSDDYLRIRTQCISKNASARLDFPKTPHIIKSVLRDSWGGRDGLFKPTDQPVYLDNDSDSLDIASHIVHGDATSHLPIIYVSCISDRKWIFSRSKIEKIASELCGVAHVVVEPSIDFSFHLKDQTKSGNVYGGTIGLFAPERGFLRSFYVGWEHPDTTELAHAIVASAARIRSYMPAAGMDWTQLQEEALAIQRGRDRARLSYDDMESLYNEEMSNLKERNNELQDKIEALQQELSARGRVSNGSSEALGAHLSEMLGPEIYEGEFGDRLRLVARLAQDSIDRAGLDTRSAAFIGELIKAIQPSKALARLRSDLNSATNDAKRMADDIGSLMRRHGFYVSAENKHMKLTPLPGYWGLGTITVSKTPSDAKGLKNQRSDIERAIGLTALK